MIVPDWVPLDDQTSPDGARLRYWYDTDNHKYIVVVDKNGGTMREEVDATHAPVFGPDVSDTQLVFNTAEDMAKKLDNKGE